jgi:hypothetical protein
MAKLGETLTLEAWRAAKAGRRREITGEIVAGAGGALEAVRRAGAEDLPVFLHGPTQALFHLVPGGAVTVGFSAAEHDEVFRQYRGWEEADGCDAICENGDALPPAHPASVAAFLFAARPFDARQLALLREGDGAARERVIREGRKVWRYAEVAKLPAEKYVKYLDAVGEGTLRQIDVDAVEEQLRAHGLRLPTDDEWEAAARAGGATPFATGSTIPSSPNVGVNRFGFVDMGAWPEVVAGHWSSGVRRARGGAAMCYPWQGCGEWTLLLCANRTGAKEFDGLLCVRPAMEIG